MADRELNFVLTANTSRLGQGMSVARREVREYREETQQAADATQRLVIEIDRVDRAAEAGVIGRTESGGLRQGALIAAQTGGAFAGRFAGSRFGRIGLAGMGARFAAPRVGGAVGAGLAGFGALTQLLGPLMLAIFSLTTAMRELNRTMQTVAGFRRRALETGEPIAAIRDVEAVIRDARLRPGDVGVIPALSRIARAQNITMQEALAQISDATARMDPRDRARLGADLLGPGGGMLLNAIREQRVDVRRAAPFGGRFGPEDRALAPIMEMPLRGAVEEVREGPLFMRALTRGPTGLLMNALKDVFTRSVRDGNNQSGDGAAGAAVP